MPQTTNYNYLNFVSIKVLLKRMIFATKRTICVVIDMDIAKYLRPVHIALVLQSKCVGYLKNKTFSVLIDMNPVISTRAEIEHLRSLPSFIPLQKLTFFSRLMKPEILALHSKNKSFCWRRHCHASDGWLRNLLSIVLSSDTLRVNVNIEFMTEYGPPAWCCSSLIASTNFSVTLSLEHFLIYIISSSCGRQFSLQYNSQIGNPARFLSQYLIRYLHILIKSNFVSST